MSNALTVVLVPDTSRTAGLGHFYRCLRLGIAIQATGGHPVIVGARFSSLQRTLLKTHRIKARKIPGVSATKIASFLKHLSEKPSWIVTDHYELAAEWERAVRPYVERIAAFDDADGRRHQCDLIINAALSPRSGRRWYRSTVSPRTTLLLGPEFALPDPLLAKRGRRSRKIKGVRSLCFFLGGGASSATFRRYLHGVLANVPASIQKIICIPPKDMRGSTKLSSDRRLSVVRDYSRLKEVLGGVDLFVGSGGAISFDRTVAGVPGVVVSMAPNQVDLCRYLAKGGTQLYLGDYTSVSPHELGNAVALLTGKVRTVNSMASRCDGVVDGRGAERITNVLRRSSRSGS